MESGSADGGAMNRSARCKAIGITGGIGVGKSIVAQAFARRGALVLEADRIGHEVLREDAEVQRALAQTFGAEVIGAEGQPDRKSLGERVFGDPEALAALNRIVHPPLLARLRERLDAGRRDPSVPLVVVDAALIAEWRIRSWFDFVIAVTAPAEQVRARLLAKGLSQEQIERRIASQLPEEARVKDADMVIQNDGDVWNIETAVEKIWRRTAGSRMSNVR